MTYDECVCQAAIAIHAGRNISPEHPEYAIDAAENIADALKESGYLDKEKPPKPPKEKPAGKTVNDVTRRSNKPRKPVKNA
jgi:hypothetical protein